MAQTIRTLRTLTARASEKTLWVFVEIETAEGLKGLGEASLQRQEQAVEQEVARLGRDLVGRPANKDALARFPAPKSLPEAAARSAVDLALHDLDAKARGVSLATALGGARRTGVPIYANINRRTVDRGPAGFRESALDAIEAGFSAFKIAPFDEVSREALAGDQSHRCLDAGLERIASVREVIGPDRELMVDCHWRFDEATARAVLTACESLNLHWFECPLPEDDDNLGAIVRLRAFANGIGVRLAGCEMAIGLAGFRAFVEAGAYDVMMPDVKYVGGLAEVLRIADLFEAKGIAFSPHNPSGPICHMASLIVSSVAPGLDRLEMQFDESPLFDDLVSHRLPPIRNGVSDLSEMNGLGVELRHDLLI